MTTDFTTASHEKRPYLWFIAPVLGAWSEIWLERQVLGIERFELSVVAWRDWYTPRPETYPEVHLIDAPHPGRENPKPVARWQNRLKRLHHRNIFRLGAKAFTQFKRLAAAKKPDIILVHFGHTGLAMLGVARFLKIPMVVHFHGADISGALGNRWYRWSLKHNIKAFSHCIAVGSSQRKTLISLGMPAEKISVIPCGVPIRDFSRGDIAYSEKTAGIRYISVARLEKSKGFDVALRAFARLRETDPEAHYSIVGDGNERPSLEALVRELGLADHVTFMGKKPAHEVRQALAHADVFIQHSLTVRGWVEGFGVSITEAAAMELPVIVTRSGGIPDQVIEGETGFLIEERDEEALVARMKTLGRDPELRRRMGRAGRANAIANFDTKGQIEKLEAVLLDVLAKG